MAELCVWSNKADTGTRPVSLKDDGVASVAPAIILVCPSHEAKLRRFLRYAERYKTVLLAAVLLSVISIAVTAIMKIEWGIGVSLIGLGCAFIAFPFPTPETAEKLGVYKAIWATRFIGVVVIGLGFDALRG